ncbi:MAG: RNA-guided endonuclease TnpB family protein [Nanoarchaeota archaeon]
MTKRIIKGYRFRIFPTEEQKTFFIKSFGCSRFVFNYFLNIRKEHYIKNKKGIWYNDTAKLLVGLKKKEDTKWLNEVNSQSLQQSLRQLDVAYQRFFKKVSMFPSFKSKYDKQSFCVPQHFTFENGFLIIPKLNKSIKVNQHREFGKNYKICFLTILKTKTNKYFVSFVIEEDFTPKTKETNKSIGIDLGIVNLMTFSDNKKVSNPKIAKKYQKKIKYQQRQHSKKTKKEKNKERVRIRLAKIYEKITNIKTDYIHKLTSNIVKNHDIIAMEDLDIMNMIKDHKKARFIQEVSWYEIIRQIKYKSEWNNKRFVQINKWFPSSKTCNNCGYINQLLKENDREWECVACNIYHDRDYNASLNILKQGLCVLGNKSHDKQKRGEALKIVSMNNGESNRVNEPRNLSALVDR